jgi:hypothetical protein
MVKSLSYNHCCCGKAIRITYSKSVFVALFVQHAMRKHRIVIGGLSGSTMVFHIISETVRFSKKKKKVTEHEKCVSIFPTNLFETLLTRRRNEQHMIKTI